MGSRSIDHAFTPGPWTARWICNNDWNVAGPKPPSYGNESFIEADARLMAAAPEMYKALKGAAWLYDQMAMGPLEAAAKYGDTYEPPSNAQCLEIRGAIQIALDKAVLNG
jgi:hypothetical protein